MPKILNDLINYGYIISIIQFGSSVRKNNYKDIDIAVIVKQNCYDKFVKQIYKKNLLDLIFQL